MRNCLGLFGIVGALLLLPTDRFAQSPTGTLIGTIRSTLDGKPIAGIRVAAMAASDRPTLSRPELLPSIVRIVDTNEQGRYRLESLPPGRYYVVVGPMIDPIYYPGTNKEDGATAVSVTAGSLQEGLDVSRKPVTAGEQMQRESEQGAYELWKLHNLYKLDEVSIWDSMDEMHRFFVDKFVATPGMGSGRMSAMTLLIDANQPVLVTRNGTAGKDITLELSKLELIGIARHEQPVAFERIAHGTDRWVTRKLSKFESDAISQLKSGKDIVTQNVPGGRLAVGAIRAEPACLRCHTTQRDGDVLGAFSYTLAPKATQAGK